jgi:hypothetical protein
MWNTVRTIRVAALMLAGLGLLANGVVAAPCARGVLTNEARDCCHGNAQGHSAGCSHACCQSPASKPERTTPGTSRSTLERIDGKAGWVAATVLAVTSGDRLERHGLSPDVPTSGSPSLITQHVRLQT